MNRTQMIANLRRARALARAVYDATDLPQIQMTLRHADQNLHWALWNFGQIDGLRPDLPGSIADGKAHRSQRRGALRAPSRRKSKPAR